MAHWFCDTFFSEQTPIIGRPLIRPFREHHADPTSILRHDLVELHGNSCVPVVLVLGTLALLGWEPSGASGVFASAWLFFLALATLATNQVHRWAHSHAAPAPARWLQRHGLILSPEGHARHHRGGFDRSFCITTGWLNPLLDQIDLFPRLERLLRSRVRGA
jgi:ubiquitin-conjugating enzyme E2 variant